MKLKKFAIVLGIASVIVSSAYAETEVKVFVDNEEIKFETTAPSIVDGRVMVPVRAVFEKAGAQVNWDGETRVTTLSMGDYEVTIKVDEPFLVKNGKPIALDVPASIIDESLAIPVRAISEAMDFGVTWNGIRNSVLISTNGKAYRANSQWKAGFHTLGDGGFVSQNSLDDIKFFDLDGDDANDALAFVPEKFLEDKSRQVPALWINGQCFNDVLDKGMVPYAVAVEDIVSTDKYVEIVVLYNSNDGRCAGFYRYNGTDVFQIKANNTENGMIYFINNLFVDGIENIVSDVDGLCFLDNMICTGIYSLENTDICRYMLKLSNIKDKTFTRVYTDNIPYNYYETRSYDKGEYIDSQRSSEVLYSNDIAGFKVVDYYVDEQDPSKFELFVEMPDKTTAVLWAYYE